MDADFAYQGVVMETDLDSGIVPLSKNDRTQPPSIEERIMVVLEKRPGDEAPRILWAPRDINRPQRTWKAYQAVRRQEAVLMTKEALERFVREKYPLCVR